MTYVPAWNLSITKPKAWKFRRLIEGRASVIVWGDYSFRSHDGRVFVSCSPGTGWIRECNNSTMELLMTKTQF